MADDKRVKSGYDREDDLDYVTESPQMIDGMEVLGPGYEKVLDNGMVRDLTSNGRIVYSHDFYVAMYKKLEAGMDSGDRGEPRVPGGKACQGEGCRQ